MAKHFYEKIVNKNCKISRCEWLIEQIFNQGIKDYQWLGFTGGNVSIPRTFLGKDNCFDEEFGPNWGFEDFELGYRLWKNGYKFEYDYNAVAYHMSHYRSNFNLESSITSRCFVEKVDANKVQEIVDFVNGNIKKGDLLRNLAELSC